MENLTFPTTSPGRYDKQQAKVRRSLPSCRGAHIHTTSIKHLFFQACRDGYQRLLFQSSRPSRLLLSRCPSSVSNSMYHSMSHLQRAPRRTHSIPCLLCHTILGKSTLPATSRPLWPRGRRFLMQQQHFRLTFLSLLALGCILLLSMLRPRITFPAIMLCKCMLSILRYDSSHCDSLLPLYLTLAFPPSLSLAVSLVCSFAPSLVTPTPKKHSCSCKGKSLGLLCKNFIQTYNTRQVVISINDAAWALGVERRRIYDMINIFESLDIVARKCQDTYNWLGISNLAPSSLWEVAGRSLQRVCSRRCGPWTRANFRRENTGSCSSTKKVSRPFEPAILATFSRRPSCHGLDGCIRQDFGRVYCGGFGGGTCVYLHWPCALLP